jgi:hypothetical protein
MPSRLLQARYIRTVHFTGNQYLSAVLVKYHDAHLEVHEAAQGQPLVPDEWHPQHLLNLDPVTFLHVAIHQAIHERHHLAPGIDVVAKLRHNLQQSTWAKC